MVEISSTQRLAYALVVSLVVHFFCFIPLQGKGGGEGGPLRYPGTLTVDVVDLSDFGAEGGVEAADLPPRLESPVALEAKPEPEPAPVVDDQPPRTVKSQNRHGKRSASPKVMPSLTREKSEGDLAKRGREKGAGDDGLPGKGGLGLIPGEPAPLELADPLSLPDHHGSRSGSRRPRSGRDNDGKEPSAPAAPVFRPAKCASCPPPSYPPLALERGLEGKVTLNVQVLNDGNVGDVYIEDGPGIPLLENTAIAAVKKWTFYPATENDQPITSKKRITIPFTLTPR
jgi:TonB family protein